MPFDRVWVGMCTLSFGKTRSVACTRPSDFTGFVRTVFPCLEACLQSSLSYFSICFGMIHCEMSRLWRTCRFPYSKNCSSLSQCTYMLRILQILMGLSWVWSSTISFLFRRSYWTKLIADFSVNFGSLVVYLRLFICSKTPFCIVVWPCFVIYRVFEAEKFLAKRIGNYLFVKPQSFVLRFFWGS